MLWCSGVNLGLADLSILGIHLPVGLQWMPARSIEIFGEVAPCLYVAQKKDPMLTQRLVFASFFTYSSFDRNYGLTFTERWPFLL